MCMYTWGFLNNISTLAISVSAFSRELLHCRKVIQGIPKQHFGVGKSFFAGWDAKTDMLGMGTDAYKTGEETPKKHMQDGPGTEPEPETRTIGTVSPETGRGPEPSFSQNRNRNRHHPFLLKHIEDKTFSRQQPSEPKTGTAGTVPCTNRNRAELKRGHPAYGTIWMQLFCLQLEVSCLQSSFFAYSCVWELFYLQLELFCLTIGAFSTYSWSFFAAKSANCKQKSFPCTIFLHQ